MKFHADYWYCIHVCRREAEEARQAELERQRRKALEIEKERERQMQKLALQREAEMRELEKKRKEEWARKRLKELESQRDWEKKSLQTLRAQHSELEKELQHLDQRKLGAAASVERQRQLSTEVSTSMRTLSLSHDIRRAELTKLHSELNVSLKMCSRDKTICTITVCFNNSHSNLTFILYCIAYSSN